MAENITQFPKTFLKKRRGMKSKRWNFPIWRKLPGKKILDTGENVLKPIWRVCFETLDIVNTVLSNGAAVADVNMDFNRKTFENYCSSTENQSGNSKRNK
jgi:hypothetical protein